MSDNILLTMTGVSVGGYIGLSILSLVIGFLLIKFLERMRARSIDGGREKEVWGMFRNIAIPLTICATVFFLIYPMYFSCVIDEVDRESVDEEISRRDIYSTNIEANAQGRGKSSGTLFYQSGSFIIETSNEYTYYCMTDRGLKREALPVNQSFIRESSEEKPAVIKYRKCDIVTYGYKDKRAKHKEYAYVDNGDYDYYYVFVVPEGSVVKTFEVN